MLTVTGALFETEVHARRHRFPPTSRQNGMMSRDPGALSMGSDLTGSAIQAR